MISKEILYCRRKTWSTDGNTVEKSSEVRTEESVSFGNLKAFNLGRFSGAVVWCEQKPGGSDLRSEWQVNAKVCVCVCVYNHFKKSGW